MFYIKTHSVRSFSTYLKLHSLPFIHIHISKDDLKKWIFADVHRVYNFTRRSGMDPTEATGCLVTLAPIGSYNRKIENNSQRVQARTIRCPAPFLVFSLNFEWCTTTNCSMLALPACFFLIFSKYFGKMSYGKVFFKSMSFRLLELLIRQLARTPRKRTHGTLTRNR